MGFVNVRNVGDAAARIAAAAESERTITLTEAHSDSATWVRIESVGGVDTLFMRHDEENQRMAGSYYIALSGMHARLEALDRLATDLANVSTVGYKAGRTTTTQADRDDFGVSLQAAIDVTDGPTHIDSRAGVIASTGRDLDVAVDGPGMFAIDTPAGTRYTHDGRFVRRADGILATASRDGRPGRGRQADCCWTGRSRAVRRGRHGPQRRRGRRDD